MSTDAHGPEAVDAPVGIDVHGQEAVGALMSAAPTAFLRQTRVTVANLVPVRHDGHPGSGMGAIRGHRVEFS